jgi:hypothetical protein
MYYPSTCPEGMGFGVVYAGLDMGIDAVCIVQEHFF